MSKQETLASCIARMYEGGRLEKSGTPPGTVKKQRPALVGNLNNVEVKLNVLEGKVEQIECVQTEVLQKLSSLCQGMESLEKCLMQHKPGAQESNLIKNGQRDTTNKHPLLTEVRSLCGETVDLLHDLKQESQQQRKKIEGIESSLSTLDKVLRYVGDAFRNSKIVEFILNGVVPWRKQGLLETVKEEKNQPDGNIVKHKDRSTQTSEDVKEVFSAELHQPEVTIPTVPKLPFPDALTKPNESILLVSKEVSNKALRKAKEVTAKSREPARVQTFAPEDLEAEKSEVHDVPEEETNSSHAAQTNIKCVNVTAAKVEEDVVQPERALEQVEGSQVGEENAVKKTPLEQQQVNLKAEDLQGQPEVSQVAEEPSLKSAELSKQEKQLEKNVEGFHKHAEISQVSKEVLLKPAALGQQQQLVQMVREPQKSPQCTKEPSIEDAKAISQHKETVETLTSLPKHDERTPDFESAIKRDQTTTDEKILESDIVKNCADPISQTAEPVKEEDTNSRPLSKAESHSLIIDDCPPLPAPFEHRIVSAKQVSMSTYYTVSPSELLGGGRFGQVHKCAELSSGLTLAAKMIKVRGMKERDEVKNEIGVMNQLNHVNLIQLYDAFESRTNLTLIMEYVEGGELFERIIDENYQLTELDAIVFTRQICEGVQYLHQQYILHLDLKPENILCVNTTGNQIKIIDFGLARKYRPREKLKVNFGTPEFLAPEVVNYDFVSFPTDMWSVGVITYMLLSGLSPFMGDNDAETMNNILHAKWDFDAEAFENVSEEAKDFISRLLVPAKCSRLSASGCMKHSWLNNLEDKAKMYKVRLKSHMRLQRYLVAHRQWKKHFYAVAAANRLKRFQQDRSVSTPN
ncbi:myosin light chain kinase 3 isoform X1 [Misgurnus anguillicaudatus]|uniref:myosin light chain kinase 3 isoform X1 n=1 Tax=Misgurnus anguillicaudatus TaxID=75329 RepID=UPI003CCF4F37